MREIADELAAKVAKLGQAAARVGDPVTTCPYAAQDSPTEAALARIWVGGYLSVRPPLGIDYDKPSDVIEDEEAPPALPAAETSRARPRGDEALKRYWMTGEGAVRWASWTDLYEHLKKHMADEKARQIAASWFHERYGRWPGSDENRVAHGKAPRGDKVGPG